MADNDYVATATAEKRLREVLAVRFGSLTKDLIDELAAILLTDAEITYLPRKRSVSILLRYPEKASQAILDRPASNGADVPGPASGKILRQDGSDPMVTEGDNDKPKVARFGLFVPTVTSAPDYHEDDYFTE